MRALAARAAALARWAWNPPPEAIITGHPFTREDWLPGDHCGYLAHPQASICDQPRRYHAGEPAKQD